LASCGIKFQDSIFGTIGRKIRILEGVAVNKEKIVVLNAKPGTKTLSHM